MEKYVSDYSKYLVNEISTESYPPLELYALNPERAAEAAAEIWLGNEFKFRPDWVKHWKPSCVEVQVEHLASGRWEQGTVETSLDGSLRLPTVSFDYWPFDVSRGRYNKDG